MARRRKIWIPVVCILATIIISTLIIYFFGAFFVDFNNLSKKEFLMPGLDTSFVPQGLDYNEKHSKFLVSGYMANGDGSRIYIVDGNTYNCEKYVTVELDEELACDHFGGITSYQNTIWVTGTNSVFRINMVDVLNTINGHSVEALDEFLIPNNTDFLTVYNNKLVVGEFYRQKSFETDPSHAVKTQNGTNRALGFVYNINEHNKYGVNSTTPEYAISLPDIVQGMCLNKDGNIVLSTSYSIFDSHLYIHKNILESNNYTTIKIADQSIKTYILDNTTLLDNITCPAMTEEVALVNDRVFVGFENASSKYKLVNRVRSKYIYSLGI